MNNNLTPPTQSKSGKLKLILLFLIAFGPLGLAYFMFKTGFLIPKGTVNNGVFINPVLAFSSLTLENLDGKAYDITADKKWSLVLVGDERYIEVFKKQIYLINQIHIAIGKDQDRLKTIYLVPDKSRLEHSDNKEAIEFLQKEYSRTQIAVAKDNSFFQLIQELMTKNREAEYSSLIYIVDPLGNAILYYRPNMKGEDILDDLKRLLKYSNIG